MTVGHNSPFRPFITENVIFCQLADKKVIFSEKKRKGKKNKCRSSSILFFIFFIINSSKKMQIFKQNPEEKC
jgi:hypothetical protein